MDAFSKKPPMDAPADEMVERPYKAALVDELIGLDKDLMKMLVRRTKLLGKLRGGKTHAASPAAAKAEKAVRMSWERNALSFSRDDRFSRQLFALLQEIRMDSREEAEARSGGFNLAPAQRAVSVAMGGPVSVTGSRMLAALAASLGSALVLENAVLNTPLLDCVKALNSAGAGFTWTPAELFGNGKLTHAAGTSPLVLATDKALYIGEDTLTMYLLAFLAVARVGRVRFTGGSGLKMADLSPLRRFLPSLGARMAHSVPKSNGLPGSVESSGMPPDHIVVPEDLPREGLVALLCAVAAWKKKVTIECGALPFSLFTSAVAECLPVLRACSVSDGIYGTVVSLDSTTVAMPANGIRTIDPMLGAYLLALPAFAGGTVSLAGQWDKSAPLAGQVLDLLAAAGLTVRVDEESVLTDMSGTANASGLSRPIEDALDEALVPLALALAVRSARSAKGRVDLPSLPEGVDTTVLEAFCAHLGVACESGALTPLADEERQKSPWTSPNALWAFAYALCAYDSPNISLANPSVVTALMPSFWTLYNALPDPSAVKKAAPEEQKPRRRILSTGVQGE